MVPDTKKLLAIADLMDRLPAMLKDGDEFDMGTFETVSDCGTADCAYGWGHRLLPDLQLPPPVAICVDDGPENENKLNQAGIPCIPAINGLIVPPMGVVALALDLTHDEAKRLFDYESYPVERGQVKPDMVARRIRDFVAAEQRN